MCGGAGTTRWIPPLVISSNWRSVAPSCSVSRCLLGIRSASLRTWRHRSLHVLLVSSIATLRGRSRSTPGGGPLPPTVINRNGFAWVGSGRLRASSTIRAMKARTLRPRAPASRRTSSASRSAIEIAIRIMHIMTISSVDAYRSASRRRFGPVHRNSRNRCCRPGGAVRDAQDCPLPPRSARRCRPPRGGLARGRRSKPGVFPAPLSSAPRREPSCPGGVGTCAARSAARAGLETGVPSRTGHRAGLALHCRRDSRVPSSFGSGQSWDVDGWL